MGNLIWNLGSQPPSPLGGSSEIGLMHAAYLFAHAILNGSALMYLTWRMSSFRGASQKARARGALADFVASSANVLFLCAGMTAVMILVNDNIARAFAIGAAVALVRFRIKMAGKFLGVALFYSVLVGMACGVSRVDIAWAVTGVFAVIVGIVNLARIQAERADALGAGREVERLKLVPDPAVARERAQQSLSKL